jgi:predicted transcriptional regulator
LSNDYPQNGDYISQNGAEAMKDLNLVNALFSNVQQRVLALIFGHAERSFYTSEIVRNVHSGTGAVERELSRLERSGLVCVERIGNLKGRSEKFCNCKNNHPAQAFHFWFAS